MQHICVFTLTALAVVLIAGLIGPACNRAPVPLTTAEVIRLQEQWGAGLVEIGMIYQAGGDYRPAAEELIDHLYGYHEGVVLFKPTKAAADQFRETREQALSYFVGGAIAEDHGFALQPWSKVRFENHGIVLDSDSATAMGNYFFTDAAGGKEVKVEFTFGIKRAGDGRPVIFLHHSSLPYLAER